MSTPNIRLKRSSVQGKSPTLDNLSLGELGINSYDGNLFARQDTGGVGIATTITNLTPWQESYGGGELTYSGDIVVDSATFNNNVSFGSTVGVGQTLFTDDVKVSGNLSLNGAGSQFFAFNEDTVKVKFANWYSSNTRQYGQGQLWYEQWFGAIDDTAGAANRRIGFYLDTPNAGSSDSAGGSGSHPTNARAYIDVNNFWISDDLIQNPSSSVTPANNGELMVEATNNTTLTFKLKGSDGTVRSGTLTLS